jgi:hypothetical protein
MGLNPKLWGKEGWRFIHFVAVTYDPSKKEAYLNFFQNLPKILPCPVCGEHFKENMAKMPPRMESNQTVFEWTVDMHNLVNKENGKKIYTYDQAYYEMFPHAKNGYKVSDFANGILLSTAVLGILVFLTRKK